MSHQHHYPQNHHHNHHPQRLHQRNTVPMFLEI
jgi:hypothetical protein